MWSDIETSEDLLVCFVFVVDNTLIFLQNTFNNCRYVTKTNEIILLYKNNGVILKRNYKY